MGRGLGDVQRFILDTLAASWPKWSDVPSLAHERYGAEATLAEVESLRRAIRSLRRRGLVEARRYPSSPRWLDVRLSRAARRAEWARRIDDPHGLTTFEAYGHRSHLGDPTTKRTLCGLVLDAYWHAAPGSGRPVTCRRCLAALAAL
jgi:hypothetical protein